MAVKKTQHVTRRAMLKSTATALAATPMLAKTVQEQKPQAKAPRFFTPEEFALLDELTEIILPTDEHSPGARAAQVAAYIDARLAEIYMDGPRQQWRDGLRLIETLTKELYGKTFLQASEAQRLAVVARIAQGESNPNKPEEKFFVLLKQQTTQGYYTSKIGIHQELEYKGNVYLKEYVGEEAK